MLDYQGMVVLAGNLIWWTWEVEDVFKKVKLGGTNKLAMKNYAKKCHSQVGKGLQLELIIFRLQVQRVKLIIGRATSTTLKLNE